MPDIHATAIVDPRARLGDGVRIGPYCIVGGDVELGAGVVVDSHVVIDGRTKIGANCRIFPFASIGLPPQDLKYDGEPSALVIGANNKIREYVTMNPGTSGGGMVTSIGDNVIMANNATLGGHVVVGDYAVLGGLCAVHQFVRIGRHAMVGGMSGVENDVIPYGSVTGDRAHLSGLNIVGIKRRGFDRDVIHSLRRAYRLLFAPEGTMAERIADVAQLFPDNEAVGDIIEFIRSDSARAVCQPKDGREAA